MPGQNPIDEVIQTLRDGGIVIFPTETVYGMGADARNAKAVEKLFQLKKRSLNKPVPILLPHKKYIDRYCKNISSNARLLMQHFWPGPLTIILESADFPKGVSDNGKVGFRVSSHPFVQNLMHKFDGCITATSANISDKPTPTDAREFFKIFPDNSFTLVEDVEKFKAARPSTVIDCTVEPFKIIREGAIGEKEMLNALAEV